MSEAAKVGGYGFRGGPRNLEGATCKKMHKFF